MNAGWSQVSTNTPSPHSHRRLQLPKYTKRSGQSRNYVGKQQNYTERQNSGKHKEWV